MKRNDLIVHRYSRRFKNDKILVLEKVSFERDNDIFGRYIEISRTGDKVYNYSFPLSPFEQYNLGRKDAFRTLYSNELFWAGLNIMGESLKYSLLGKLENSSKEETAVRSCGEAIK